jgi:hypothetical protein
MFEPDLYPPYASGSGYFISRPSFVRMTAQMDKVPYNSNEDAYAGMLRAACGSLPVEITVTKVDRLIGWASFDVTKQEMLDYDHDPILLRHYVRNMAGFLILFKNYPDPALLEVNSIDDNLSLWLSSISPKFPALYQEKLIEHGLESLSSFFSLTPEQLKELNIFKFGHYRLISAAVQKLMHSS